MVGGFARGETSIPLTSAKADNSDSEVSPTQAAVPDVECADEVKDNTVHTANTTGFHSKAAGELAAAPKDDNSTSKRSVRSSKTASESVTALGMSPFNPRTPKLGRQRKNRAAEDSRRNSERKEFNNGAKLRNALRGDDVTHVEEFLKSRKPSLLALSSYLNTFEVRFRGHKNKKMAVAERVPAESCAPYSLPETTLRAALDLIECMTHYGDTMDVSKPPEASDESWIVRSANSRSDSLWLCRFYGA